MRLDETNIQVKYNNMVKINWTLCILLPFLGQISCTSNSESSKENTCKITDTIINKLILNCSQNEFKSFLNVKENTTLAVNGIKLNCKYTPNFYHDKLYSINVDLTQAYPHKEPSQALEMVFEKETKINYEIEDAYKKVLEIYSKKYGQPIKIIETGKKGEWKKEYGGAIIREYGEFDIHKLYVWNCNSRDIKIEFDIHAHLTEITWNSQASEKDILANKSYLEQYYDNFIIKYSDLKTAELVNQEQAKKGMENFRKNDSIQKINDNKLKDNI